VTDRERILEAYYRHEKALGGPHMVNDAIWLVVVELGDVTREEAKEVVIADQCGGAA
jgi:hypothetical protein